MANLTLTFNSWQIITIALANAIFTALMNQIAIKIVNAFDHHRKRLTNKIMANLS